MSELTVQQSYLLFWELFPDRNRKSMGLWYWELMSHPDPAVLPVGTLHSLEWFWVSRRISIYFHHNTFVFFSKTSAPTSKGLSGQMYDHSCSRWSFLPEASFGLRVLSLPAFVRPYVTKFVRAITRHPFKLGSPNLDNRCKRPWLIYPILSLSVP